MTEEEWWAATDAKELVVWLHFAIWPTKRKFRLLAAAWSRRLLPLVANVSPLADLIAATEALADGGATPESLLQLHAACDLDERNGRPRVEASAWAAILETPDLYINVGVGIYPLSVLAYACDALSCEQSPGTTGVASDFVQPIHELFGPLPFHDIEISPSWLTSDVRLLAQGIYDEKAFDRMPILADALQDAGCDNEDILAHCRAGNWEHVRGCWVIDLLLGHPWREES
jgi:hypothetical protein